MNGEGRMQRGGHVLVNDFGDGRNDKEARVACLGNDSEDSFVTASEGLEDRDHSLLDYTAPLEGQAEPDRIGSWGMHVEAAAEGIICMETEIFGNVGPTACIGAPKRATQNAGQAAPPNVLHFGSDQRAITNCGMSVEAAEEDEFTLENSISGNVRPAACIGPPKRPIQTADHAGQSNVLRFGSDQRGIGSCRRSVEAAEEEIQCIAENDFGNVGFAVCTGPQKRPTQAARHGGPSFVQRFGSDQ